MAEKKNQNAVKHGAFAEALILPGEDIEEFKKLHASLVDEWAPEGPSEDDKVMSVAQNMWRKLRFRRYLQTRVAAIKQQDETIRKRRSRDYDRAIKVLEEIESGVPNSITEENLVDKLGKIHAEHVKKTVPRKNYDSENAWLSALSDSMVGLLEAILQLQADLPPVDERLGDEPLAERELAFEERLDAKIDRDIKQLGQTKTMKAVGLGRRTIAAPDKPPKQIE